MSDDVDSKFDPVRVGELSDLDLLPGEFRAFRSEVRDSLQGIVRALQTLGRIEERMNVLIDRQNHLESRMLDVERVQANEVSERKRLAERVDALESRAKTNRPKRARK